jgi:hypothetical protein
MATVINLVAGVSVENFLTFGMSEVAALDAFQVEIGQKDKSLLKFRWPTTTGFKAVTKSGTDYTISITTLDTLDLRGIHEIEFTAFVGDEAIVKERLTELFIDFRRELK